MVFPTRWIVVDDQRMPIGHVAARTLRRRLEAVWLELPRADSCADLNPSRVHRLRVATRRGLVALDAFRPLLSSSRCAWFEKRLRRIRHAAGEARDIDVLADRLANKSSSTTTLATPSEEQLMSPAARTVRNRLITMLAKQRDVSRRPIHLISVKLRDNDWPGRLERLLDDIPRSHRQMSFGNYARQRFKPMAERFFWWPIESCGVPMRCTPSGSRGKGFAMRWSFLQVHLLHAFGLAATTRWSNFRKCSGASPITQRQQTDLAAGPRTGVRCNSATSFSKCIGKSWRWPTSHKCCL